MKKKKNTYGHGHIFNRGGNYYLQIRDHNGKLVQRALIDPNTNERARTISHAKRIAPIIAQSLKTGETPIKKKKNEPIHLRDLYQEFLNDDGNIINLVSSKNRDTVMERFIKDFPTVEDISRENLQEWRKKRLLIPTRHDKIRTPANVNREVSFLKRVLTWAVENDKIKSNPLINLKPLKENNNRERILSRDERVRFLEALKDEHFTNIRLIVLIAMYTGMRRGEILELKWENVDFENKIFHLIKTKTGKPRKVPIPEMILVKLKEMDIHSQWVFPSSMDPSKHVSDFKKSFATLLKKAKIKNFTFHDLRHVAATLMVEQGVHARVMMEIFGWSTMKMAERYTNPADDIMHKAVNSITKGLD